MTRDDLRDRLDDIEDDKATTTEYDPRGLTPDEKQALDTTFTVDVWADNDEIHGLLSTIPPLEVTE